MENRFKKIRELGSKGKRSNPLMLDEFQWENEWVNENCEPVHEGGGNDMTWDLVDEAVGATQGLEGRNMPRAAATCAALFAPVCHTYARNRKRPRKTLTQDIDENDDEQQQQNVESDSATAMEEDEAHADGDGDGHGDGDGGFYLNNDLLD
jgi:hypothetical protein